MARVSAPDVAAMKGVRKIVAVTAYDYTMATLCGRAGADIMLVGDSAGMVVLGHEGTAGVTMEHMCAFTGAVGRAGGGALVVADLPFMSYQASDSDAVRNAGRLVAAGAGAVKLEGGSGMAGRAAAISRAGIPVMGHVGLTPQTSGLAGKGRHVQGRTAASAAALAADAAAVEEAGAFCVVLEMVAAEAAAAITGSAGVPTIGIGSGAGCDGQVLVIHDLLGMYDKVKPRFAKRYLDLAGAITGAVEEYGSDVREGRFPAEENTFRMDGGEAEAMRRGAGAGGG